MDFPAQFATVEKRASDALSSVKAAATESREQLQSRIDQAQVDMDLAKKDAQQKIEAAEDRAQSKWAQMKADARPARRRRATPAAGRTIAAWSPRRTGC